MKFSLSPILRATCFCLIILGFIAGCKQAPPLTIPTIQTLSPAQASPGEPVFVMGSWLQLSTELVISGNGSVTRLGLGEFSVVSDDSLLFLTPNLPQGDYLLSLYNAEEGASRATEFQVIAPRPIIQGFESLCNAAGDTACVFGIGFSTDSLAITMGSLSVSNILSVSETQICFVIPFDVPEGRIPVRASTTMGTSNAWDFILCSASKDGPTITRIEPSTLMIGDTLGIQGTNFIPDSTVVNFTGALSPIFPFEVTTTSLKLTVPADAQTGLLVLKTPKGTAPAQIVIVGDLEITRIIPAANPAGGPVLIFGKGLDQVTEVNIDGNPISTGEFTYVPQTNMIATNVPIAIGGALPRPSSISVSIFDLESPAYPYELKNGFSGNIITGTRFSIIFPNFSASTNIGGINNLWMVAYYLNNGNVGQGEFPMNGFIGIEDSLNWIDNQARDTLGYYNLNSKTLNVHNAVGWKDTTYEPEVSRFIMTPLLSGNQFELIYPKCGGIDNLSTDVASTGDTVSIYGWPFFSDRYMPWDSTGFPEGEFYVMFDCEIIRGYHENCTRIIPVELQIRELKFVVPAVEPGLYDIRVGNIYNTSNIVKLQVE